MKLKEKQEQYIYECERCGRKNVFPFYQHATSKLAMDWCEGNVRKIKWKHAW